MEIKVNKEIRNYKESIFLGLSIRQCFFSILACIAAVCVFFLLIDILGMEITSWCCMLAAAPFAALGFITYQGMYAEEIFITSIRSFILQHTKLVDKPFNLHYEIMKFYIDTEQKKGVVKHVKKLSKIKKAK